MFYFFYFITIFFISLIIYRIFIPVYRKNIIDIPNLRSSHKIAKPTGGGLIFALMTSLLDLFQNNYLSIISLPLSILGFIDDKKNISSILRFFSQFLTVLVLIFLTMDHSIFLKILSEKYFLVLIIPLTIFLTGIINFTNFMDGIDGLVAGSMLVIFIFFSFKNEFLFFSIIPLLFAFLFYNWHPSQIFMGDSGSNFLGSIYITMLLKSSSIFDFFILLALASPLFLDAATCLIRRYLNNQNIFKPHKLHLYQRLIQSGFSHALVSTFYISGTLLIGIVTLSRNLNFIIFVVCLIFIIGIYLDKNVALSFHRSLISSKNKSI
tara:strand:+ start:10602 stop:11567 length:966 start_codon:yes stop_codon:yes gene_type:complete